jgi:class 3 adenylate cyclase
MKETQVPARFNSIIVEEEAFFGRRTKITERNSIPDTTEIPITDPLYWLKIPDVICVFVDMKNSTGVSADTAASDIASIYRLFTGTAVRLFHEADAPYIDVRGDGAFALFNSDQAHRALAAAVTFKTFGVEVFLPKVKEKTIASTGLHIGIDLDVVLVRKLGLKIVDNRTDRQNEVWAGRPVNMAAKLASLAKMNEIIVSDRFHEKLTDEKALKSCGCGNGYAAGQAPKEPLWKDLDLADDDRFDFDQAHSLESGWCSVHGSEFCEHLMSVDGD